MSQLRGSANRIAKHIKAKGKDNSKGEAKDQQKPKDTKQPGGGDDDKSVSLNAIQWLTGGSYDLSQAMGSLLKDRFIFISLSGIREAYSSAFNPDRKREKTDAIDNALAYVGLDAVSAVRNCIVHRSGVPDDEYSNATDKIKSLPQAEKGKAIVLDGQQCRQMIDDINQSCVRLLQAVDDWIS